MQSQKGDNEKSLGEGTFVERIFSEDQKASERLYALKPEGMTVSDAAEQVAQVLDMTAEKIWLPGKFKQEVLARCLLCFLSVHEFGESITAFAECFGDFHLCSQQIRATVIQSS